MAWEKLKSYLIRFDQFLEQAGIKIKVATPIGRDLALMRDFLHDAPGENGDQWVKQRESTFHDFFQAAISARRLAESVVELQGQPRGELRERLDTILSGSITQDFQPTPAKDKLYELEMALAFKRAGFDVALREPDIAISGNGLSRQLGVACKYLASLGSIHEHISKGYQQITRQNLDGFVAVGLDVYIMKQAFADKIPKFLDFRDGPNPLKTTLDLMTSFMANLVVERDRDYPSEKALDGALTSLTLWGIAEKRARPIGVHAWALQAGPKNPLLNDMQVVQTAMQGLRDND